MIDAEFPVLKQHEEVRNEVLDVLVWRDIRLGGFEDLALVILAKGGLDEYADFELDLRKAAGVSFAHELLSDDSLKAFILSKLGKLADGGKASNDDDGDHPNDGQDGPDGSAPNGKSPPKDDNTGGDGGKATDSAVPPKPTSPVGGEEPMDLGDDVAKAADPIAYEAVKTVEAPADEGELGSAAKSPLPEASTAGLKDTLMEECMPADAAVSKSPHDQQQIPILINDEDDGEDKWRTEMEARISQLEKDLIIQKSAAPAAPVAPAPSAPPPVQKPWNVPPPPPPAAAAAMVPSPPASPPPPAPKVSMPASASKAKSPTMQTAPLPKSSLQRSFEANLAEECKATDEGSRAKEIPFTVVQDSATLFREATQTPFAPPVGRRDPVVAAETRITERKAAAERLKGKKVRTKMLATSRVRTQQIPTESYIEERDSGTWENAKKQFQLEYYIIQRLGSIPVDEAFAIWMESHEFYSVLWKKRLLAIGTLDGRIKVIGGDNIEGLLISPKLLPYKYMEFLQNQGFIVSITNDKDIQVWNQERRSIACSLQWESNVSAFSVIRGSSFMFVGDKYGLVSVLKYDPDESLAEATGVSISNRQPIVGILPQPCSFGNRLLIAYESGLPILWDVPEAHVVVVRGNKVLELKNKVVSPNDGITNIVDDAPSHELEEKEINALCWASTDGSILAVGYVDEDILFWNTSKDSSAKDQEAELSPNVVKLQLSSAEKRLPVIVLHWLDSSKSRKHQEGQLLIYGGDEIGSEEVVTVLTLEWSSGMETLRYISRMDLTLAGSFADMILIPSAGANGSDTNTSLFMLSNPGRIHIHDRESLSSSDSQSRKELSVSTVNFLAIIPIVDHFMTVAEFFHVYGRMEGLESKTAAVISSTLTLHGDKKWPLTGGVSNHLSFGKDNTVHKLYVAGCQDGSIRFWDATYPVFSLLCILKNEVNGEKLVGSGASLTVLELCPSMLKLTVGRECGRVLLYNLCSSKETNFHFIMETKTEVCSFAQIQGTRCSAVFDLRKSGVRKSNISFILPFLLLLFNNFDCCYTPLCLRHPPSTARPAIKTAAPTSLPHLSPTTTRPAAPLSAMVSVTPFAALSNGIRDVVKEEGHQFDSFSLEVSLALTVVENKQAVRLVM
ncbi:hypothetical protein ACS0TY_029533 [Phlomoides rotata]